MGIFKNRVLEDFEETVSEEYDIFEKERGCYNSNFELSESCENCENCLYSDHCSPSEKKELNYYCSGFEGEDMDYINYSKFDDIESFENIREYRPDIWLEMSYRKYR